MARTSIDSIPSVPFMRESPSFSRRTNGSRPRRASASPAGIAPPVFERPALAAEAQPCVGEGREVAASPERAVLGDGGHHAGVQHGRKGVHQLLPDT